jgi:hypothetical protein
MSDTNEKSSVHSQAYSSSSSAHDEDKLLLLLLLEHERRIIYDFLVKADVSSQLHCWAQCSLYKNDRRICASYDHYNYFLQKNMAPMWILLC